MKEDKPPTGDMLEDSGIDQLFDESEYWRVNLGEERVHAKRMPGWFRKVKWLSASIYILFFIGPYLRWGGRQAILFDIPARKFHIFGLTIWPQDIWMLSLVLLTFFMLLYAMTAIAGRLFCGYLCWQTVWMDVYTWIEGKIEGSPLQRHNLDKAGWSLKKVGKKGLKTIIFLFLSALTGVTFTSYFIDVSKLWEHYLSLSGPVYIWTVPLIFTIGSYLGVAIMREQVCLWLCPYGRIQGVMTDEHTLMPTYDFSRGEPRARVVRGRVNELGDCVDCNMCLAVCPTGVDIRNGQQGGCITCGLCIDACDTIMEKVSKPNGLIRYMSLAQLRGEAAQTIWKRPRMLVYLVVTLFGIGGVIYGVTHISAVDLAVIHERQPLFIKMSDGRIQNKYRLKVTNKTDQTIDFDVKVNGVEGGELTGENRLKAAPGKVSSSTFFVRADQKSLTNGSSPIVFLIESKDGYTDKYKSSFNGPVK